jgi:hypothetical protein
VGSQYRVGEWYRCQCQASEYADAQRALGVAESTEVRNGTEVRNALAQLRLGICYDTGTRVSADKSETVK